MAGTIRNTDRTQCRIISGKQTNDVELEIKLSSQGAYVGKHLSFGLDGKVLLGKPLLPTGFGKTDRPG